MKIVLLEDLGVSRDVIEKEAEKLKSMGHTFEVYPRTTNVEVLKEETKDADVLLLANMPLDAKVVKADPSLKFIDVAFTGVDHVPVALCKEKGIAISNASGYANDAVAELVALMSIDRLRHVSELEQQCRKGQTKAGIRGNLLKGKTVGIVGAGSIGTTTAKLLKAFGCKILGFRRQPITDPVYDAQVDLDTLLKESDIVSLHVPLTDSTRHMIGKDQLALMKPTAILINTARGAAVDEHALADALNTGQIAGAGIDVFDIEPPLPIDHPLLQAKNTLVTPHIGFDSVESMEKRAEIVFENLYAFLEGRQLNTIC